MSEIDIIPHSNNKERIRTWGWHCGWPPQWVKPAHGERIEIYQRAFQKKVAEALQKLYEIPVEGISLEELTKLSREHSFWICSDGTVCIPKPLWVYD